MTPKFESKTKGKSKSKGNRRFLHCVASLSRDHSGRNDGAAIG
jgi:hypothetical protein